MRNRAKCKKCLSIIESFHQHDYVTCQCKEIAISGGLHRLDTYANDWSNFLRVDDHGYEMSIQVKDPPITEDQDIKDCVDNTLTQSNLITRRDLIKELERLKDSYASLPEKIMYDPVTHSDLASVLLLLCAIFKADCAD